MSGHSKWSTIKRQKQLTDKARGQVFTKLGNAITVAVIEGGGVGDPESNFKLRLAIEKAKAANMPKANIDRAIARGSGARGGEDQLRQVAYEGFAPHGVAVIAEGVTDNKQRTASQVKNVFNSHGGTLGGTGSVAYLFEKTGVIGLDKNQTFDQLLQWAIDGGAQDAEEAEDQFLVYTQPQDLHKVKTLLEEKGMHVRVAELEYRPTTQIAVKVGKDTQQVVDFLTQLEELDDIHKVFANAQFEH